MIVWTIKAVILSLILIGTLHYIYNYAVDTFTTPAVKDMVDRPKKEYEDIMRTVNKAPEKPVKQESDMKSQLQSFLQEEIAGLNMVK